MRLVSAIYDDFYPWDMLGIFDELVYTTEPSKLQAGDVLVVWGGADISPTLYNRKVSRETGATEVPGWRDKVEWAMMQRAKELNIPIIGVCRGAQMLCALAGGYLIQHVNNHSGMHSIKTVDDKELVVNSIHHQMMYPFEVDHEMVAWTTTKRSDIYVDEDRKVDVPVEPEFVYYPKVRGFAMQWHPEMMRADTPATEYLFNFIKERV